MSNHSFMFLDEDFKDISKFCMRMEKNIVEGDGVDAVIWAGKISELITHYISNFVNLDLRELEQKKKLVILFNRELIPEEIYDQLDSIRQYRNIATHHDLNNEIQIAMKVHKMIFNILCWFYGVYKADDSYFALRYPGVTYRHDESFIKKLKNNTSLYIDDSPRVSLSQINADYNVHNLFNQNNVYFNEDLGKYTAYIMDEGKEITIGHFKTKEVAVRKGYQFVLSDDFKVYKNFHLIPERLESGEYSDKKGIGFDEEESLWTAHFDKTNLGYFISESSAAIARKEYIDTLPLPEPKNGSYSDYKEITFDLNHKLWCIKKEGEIYDYYDTEEEAIYNLTQVLNINIPLEKLGIVYDEEDSKWRIYYKNKYVATCDSENEAINKRLEYVSSFAQPKRNRDGEFSIHKGIYFDEKNLIWVLRIKGELLGFFDSEEDAFNFKKEFLESKGFDVSNFIFHEEESFDEDFDFKVKINSEENAIVYNEGSDEWIVHFRGNEICRCSSELDAKRSRLNHLKSMPYPPRKENNQYSLFEGIDYDINRHLWTAEHDGESLGYFDSEEDAFYALKDHLVKDGQDLRNMHFRELDDSFENEQGTHDSPADEDIGGSKGDKNDFVESESEFISYYDLFRDKDDSPSDSLVEEYDLDSLNDDSDMKSQEISLSNIEEYKKNSFYGIADKANNDIASSNEISTYDLESDDEENDFIDDLEMEKGDSEISRRFSKQNRKHLGSSRNDLKEFNFNSRLSYNNRDFKEIRFNSYDLNNYRREIILAYNDDKLFVSLEGMINKETLKKILGNDYFNNTEELNYKKEDEDLFSIYVNLEYGLESISLKEILDIFYDLGWSFDLLNYFSLKDDFDIKSIKDSGNIGKFSISTSDMNETDSKKERKGYKESSTISKDYLNNDDIARRKAYTKQEDLISSKNKSHSKTAKAIIRGGVRVSLEEAELLDNAKEEKEIKSTIIDKKPERTKEFRTSSLGDVLELNKNHEEKEDIKEEVFESEFILDDDLAGSDFDDEIEYDYLNDESGDESFNISNLYTMDEGNLDGDKIDETFDYGDIPNENGSNSNLNIGDIFDDEDDSSFEDELDSLNVLDSGSSHSDDLDVGLVSYDDLVSDGSLDEKEESVPYNKPKKIKKPKKPKKERRIHEDAFDDKYKNAYEIEYDEENDKWKAYVGGELLKYYDNPKEAVIERKKALRRKVPLPRKGLNGKYTDEEGIDFDLRERIWTISANGVIVNFAVNEKEALLKRKIFDLILNKLEIEKEEFNEDKLEEIKDMGLDSIFEKLTQEDFDKIGLNPNEAFKKLNKL